MKPSWLFSVNGVLDGFHGISCLWSIPWVFIQVIPILFTFGLCNITSSRYSESISDLYIFFFFQFLWIRILYYWRTLSLFSLFICFKSMTQSLEWKSLPGFTDSSNCVIHASASSSSKFTFSSLSPPPQCWPLQRESMMFPLKSLEYLRKTRNSETWMRRGMFDLEWCSSLVWMTK